MQTTVRSNLWAVVFILTAGCASNRSISRVQDFRAAQERHDVAAIRGFVAPNARMWFESRSGEGEPFTGTGGSWEHWDTYFHSRSTMKNWRVEGNAVTADVDETNDFMEMLDWRAKPYTMTWWLDDSGRITGVLVKGNPEKPVSRLKEFEEWAREHHPDELTYLMPNGRIDPTGDRAERWMALLKEWRASRT